MGAFCSDSFACDVFLFEVIYVQETSTLLILSGNLKTEPIISSLIVLRQSFSFIT
jgi:hypothetical protein